MKWYGTSPFNPFTILGQAMAMMIMMTRRATSKGRKVSWVLNGHANAHTMMIMMIIPQQPIIPLQHHHSHGFCGVFKLEACWKGSPIIIISIRATKMLLCKKNGQVGFLNVNRGYPISRITNVNQGIKRVSSESKAQECRSDS